MADAGTTLGSHYVLRGGDAAAERLRLLTEVKGPTTRALLDRVDLRPGMRCLDVGCGNGEVTIELARRVAPGGEAHGVDLDERILELARQSSGTRQVPASFQQADAVDLSCGEPYDLVFSRFLLTHLPNARMALTNMVAAVRPGGWIVLEDIDFAGHVCHPGCPAFERYQELYQAVVRYKGGDPQIGPKLLAMACDAGVEDLHVEVVMPTFARGAGKRIAPVTLAHIGEAVEAAGLATQDEIDRLVTELEEFAANSRTIMSWPRIFQVWGRKSR